MNVKSVGKSIISRQQENMFASRWELFIKHVFGSKKINSLTYMEIFIFESNYFTLSLTVMIVILNIQQDLVFSVKLKELPDFLFDDF